MVTYIHHVDNVAKPNSEDFTSQHSLHTAVAPNRSTSSRGSLSASAFVRHLENTPAEITLVAFLALQSCGDVIIVLGERDIVWQTPQYGTSTDMRIYCFIPITSHYSARITAHSEYLVISSSALLLLL